MLAPGGLPCSSLAGGSSPNAWTALISTRSSGHGIRCCASSGSEGETRIKTGSVEGFFLFDPKPSTMAAVIVGKNEVERMRKIQRKRGANLGPLPRCLCRRVVGLPDQEMESVVHKGSRNKPKTTRQKCEGKELLSCRTGKLSHNIGGTPIRPFHVT